MNIPQSTQEVDKMGAVGACKGMENIACTKCTEDINTEDREEKGVVAVAVGGCCDCCL
jgi:hypothetical protein